MRNCKGKIVGKKEETGDFLPTDPYEIEMMY
jgi:hypothetical protein